MWNPRMLSKLAAGAGLFLILVGVLYLLAGFSAALDSISFQDRVLRVVGDDNRIEARSVMNKLDQLRRNEPSDRPKDAENLPIETLALQLDRVKAATALLASFDKAIVLPDAPAKRAQKATEQSEVIKLWLKEHAEDLQSEKQQEHISQLLQDLDLADETGSLRTDTESLMQDLGIDLNNELKSLDNEINDNVRGIRLVRNLDNIHNVLEKIDSEKSFVSTPGESIPAPARPSLELNMVADQFKEQLFQLKGHLDQLKNMMPPSEPGTEESATQQALNRATKAFDEITPLITGSAARIQGNLGEISALLKTINSSASDIESLDSEPKPAALNALFAKLKDDAETVIGLLDSPQTESEADIPPQAVDDSNTQDPINPLEAFRQQTDDLSDYIKTTLPEFETIQKITPALAQMEIASNALSKLVVDSERINVVIDGQTLSGFEAANIYNKQVQALSEAIGKMTGSLKELSDEGLLAQLLTDDPEAQAKAGTLLRDHEKISRAEFPLSMWGWNLIDPAVLAVASREKLDILMVIIVGAIGSMIYMTQRMLKMIIHGQEDDESQRMPILWYLARPVFGAVVAFAAYLIYQTGQIAFGTDGLTETLQKGINIPILTVIGLFAGLLSWQALDMIQSKGAAWMRSGTREPLWATGLLRVLEAKGRTEESCSQHLGVTIGQIDRWISYKDQVVPEMQDRLSTWFGVGPEDLFSATSLARAHNQTPMYAIGLKPFLQRVDADQSIKSIALALGVKNEMIERWRDQKQPVPSEYQWQLLNLINDRFARFFSSRGQTEQNWAVKLRESMPESRYQNATALAIKLHTNEEWVKKWRDLYEPVPAPTAALIAEAMQEDVHVLFDSQFDRLQDHFIVTNSVLEEAIVAKYAVETETNDSSAFKQAMFAFANEMDVDVIWVYDWIKGRKPMFSPTRKAAALKLGQDEDSLFNKGGPPPPGGGSHSYGFNPKKDKTPS